MDTTVMKVVAEKRTWTHGDFETVSATSLTYDIHLPGHEPRIMQVYAKVDTAFAGVTKPQISMGFRGSTTMLMNKNFLSRAGDLKTSYFQGFCAGMSSPPVNRHPIRVTFESSSGNLSALTAGSVEIIIVYVAESV